MAFLGINFTQITIHNSQPTVKRESLEADHGDAYVYPNKLVSEAPRPSTVRVSDVSDLIDVAPQRRGIKREPDQDASAMRRLEAKPPGPKIGYADDDDVAEDSFNLFEGFKEIPDERAASRALQLYSDSQRARSPSPPRRREEPMPYHQQPEPREDSDDGPLFGDDEDAPPLPAGCDGDYQIEEDARFCAGCQVAREDMSKRCHAHSDPILPRPRPRSGPWILATRLHGRICSPTFCVFCTDLDITSSRPIESGFNDMIITLPKVINLSGLPAAALSLHRDWQQLCDRYIDLIPPEKRTLYKQMNGPSILYHLAETANIAQITAAIDACENRSFVRRIRDSDVNGGVGADESELDPSTPLSKEGLQKLKIAEGISRANKVTFPHKTNATYDSMPATNAERYKLEYARVSTGSHL